MKGHKLLIFCSFRYQSQQYYHQFESSSRRSGSPPQQPMVYQQHHHHQQQQKGNYGTLNVVPFMRYLTKLNKQYNIIVYLKTIEGV